MYHAPRAGSGGGAAVGGGVAGRLIGMLPPPPGMGPPAHAQFGTFERLSQLTCLQSILFMLWSPFVSLGLLSF